VNRIILFAARFFDGIGMKRNFFGVIVASKSREHTHGAVEPYGHSY